ncbi:hypothetical protein [Heyndrickxia ginsengihumi]|uniref:Uncharacterized protein n=1 Tax=Heyndrickxia ginsengihumi TaxID=363870 RepID=A0A6M0P9I6_9BACI|nr:hypothetical protein [Heyndrickxia ginsengihumi]MCM3025037.1 hypothetical protein [Heyndrickxia ginsengihumi]NEY21191.1 hypothetical protein [Heyndrickxia ginsengihumi]
MYSGSATSSKATKIKWSMDKTVKYGAIAVVYCHMNAYTEITTSSGTYNLYAW